jgi:hypothetical protein
MKSLTWNSVNIFDVLALTVIYSWIFDGFESESVIVNYLIKQGNQSLKFYC